MRAEKSRHVDRGVPRVLGEESDGARCPGPGPAGGLARLLELYGVEKGRLVGYARRRLGTRPHDAEDVVQEIMRRACQSPPELRDPAALRAYLYTAVHNESTTWGGRAASEAGRRETDDVLELLADPAPGLDERVVRNLLVAQALSGLSPRERQMIELVDIRRLTEKEAAQRLGIALGTVKGYRYAARRRLRTDPGLAELIGLDGRRTRPGSDEPDRHPPERQAAV